MRRSELPAAATVPERKRRLRTGVAATLLRELPAMQRVRSADRWPDIVAAATSLYYRHGFAATSMQDIADAVGLTKGSLYHYVQSKNELLHFILKDLHDTGKRIVSQVPADTTEPLIELRQFVYKICIFSASNVERATIFERDVKFLSPELQHEILADATMYVRVAEELIQIAQRQGTLPKSLNPGIAARTLMGATNGLVRWYRPRGKRNLEQLADQMSTILVNGLLERPTPAEPQPSR